MRDILIIDGEPMDMAEGTRVTLTFASPILTDISKQAANYSQTINLPRTARNERLLGLPLSVNATSIRRFRYTRKPARLEREGLTIAEGDVYLLDSSAESISVAFIFGRIPGLETLKAAEVDINNLDAIERMTPRTWKSTADTSLNNSRIIFPLYNTGATPAEMEEAQAGYYGAVSVMNRVVVAIGAICGGITLSSEAQRILSSIWLMCSSANDSDYTASLTPTQFTPISPASRFGQYGVIIDGNVWSVYDVVPDYSGETVGDGMYGEVITTKIASATELAYQASAKQTLRVVPQNLTIKFRVNERYSVVFDRLRYARMIAYVYNPTSDELREVEGPTPTSSGAASSYDSGSNYGYQLTFDSPFQFEIEEGEQVQIRLRIPTPTNSNTSMTAFTVSGGPINLVSSGLQEPIAVGAPYAPSGNLPKIKPIDFLKGLTALFGLYITPTSAGGLMISTLNEVISNLGTSTIDWTNKIVTNERGEISLHHYFSVADYKAQRNIIAYKEDSNDIDREKLSASARNIVITCDNEGLEEEKTIATLPFAATYGDFMRHYTFKPAKDEESTAEVERKTLAPRLVKLVVVDGSVKVVTDVLSGSVISGVNYQGLQSLVKQPHRIKVRVKLSTWDIKNLNLEIPVYLAQFGAYFLVEQVQTTSTDIADVLLVKIN